MKQVELITDGSCLGNPGPGGWACVLRFGSAKKELFGFEPQTTNNRMEVMAAIQGLLALKEPCQVTIVTGAEYLRHGASIWMPRWKRRHWWKKTRPIRNVDLWMDLDALCASHQVEWTWTKGHAGHADNDRCDWLAQTAARTQTSSFPDGARHAPLRLGLTPDFVPPKPQGDLFEMETEPDLESDPG